MAVDLFSLSYVLLWVLLGVVYLAVILLYRQLGQRELHEGHHSRGGLSLQEFPKLSLEAIDGSTYELGPGRTNGRPNIIFFGTDRCRSCDEVLPVLAERSQAHPAVGLIAVYGASEETTRRMASERLLPGTIAVADPERAVFASWNVVFTPYFVALNGEGKVVGTGRSGAGSTLDDLFRVAQGQFPEGSTLVALHNDLTERSKRQKRAVVPEKE
jgi:hypothetical protein